MILSILIPVYNEEKTVNKIVEIVKKVELPKEIIEREIIIIDDCSKDKTIGIVEKIEDIKLIKHEKNKGKGGAIKTGIKEAKGDIIIIQDADLEYNPNDYSELLGPILRNETKVVYGSRFLNKKFKIFGNEKTILPLHLFGNKFLTLLTRILFNQKITDMETCYKVFKKEILDGIEIKSNRFEFEPEITAKIIKKGYKIKEIPIEYHPRDFDEGKKITWKDGIKAFYYLVKYRFFD